MEENGIADISCFEKVKTVFIDMLQSYLENGGKCQPIKGAKEFVGELCANDRFKVGLATGGWGPTAMLKLRYAGFVLNNMTLVSSDDNDERTKIMKQCVNKMGNSFERVIYFGDAEWDMNASYRLGWDFIGVGKRLKGKCDIWIEDFSDQDAIRQKLCV